MEHSSKNKKKGGYYGSILNKTNNNDIKSLDPDDYEDSKNNLNINGNNILNDKIKSSLTSNNNIINTNVLDWVTTQTTQMVHILKKEAKELDKKRQKFEKEFKLIKSVHFKDPVILNIGGIKYYTSLNTLIKYDTFFSKMFSGNFKLTPSIDGTYFIDRDGTHFRYILNYFRTGEILIPNDIFIRKELLKECLFYQINKLIDYLTVPIYIDSKIIGNNNNEMKLLNEWVFEELFDTTNIKKLNLNWKLLYRGSDHGFQANKYHELCDGYSQTVHLILSEHGNIFGGYTPIEIESVTGGKRYEDNTLTTFVFLLRQSKKVLNKIYKDNKHNNNINNNDNNNNNNNNSNSFIHENYLGKFKLNRNKYKEAIHQNKNYLSIFGDADGYTFMIYNNANKRNDNYSNPRGCFELPKKYYNDDTFLPGSREFKIKDIEIFHVS